MKGSIVIISSVHWHFTWQRHHDIASGLADRGYQVVFVEPLPKRWPGPESWQRVAARLTGNGREAGSCVQSESAAVQLLSPRLLPDAGRIPQWMNRRFFVPGIGRKVDRLGLARPLIVINYLPTGASLTLQQCLRPDLAVYDCVADWLNDPYARGLEQLEKELLGQADVVFADSPYLYERMRSLHRHVLQVMPAVHFELFDQARRKKTSMAGRPLCAYFGSIGASIDVALLRRVSHHYLLRLIGPPRVKLEGFGPQTEFIGAVVHERIPQLLADVDVLLLPYRRAAHMPAVIPAKTFECLAAGKPTVAIGLDSLAQFGDLFYRCQTEEAFLAAIEAAIKEDPALPTRRLQCARENSWQQRLDQIEAAFTLRLTERHQGAARHSG
ncbi:MAG: glycosyltransferase [Chloroflexi bacterium]|nr:glycosyltransferase [Chloroflexota bacterium]MCI0650189.1 glycosyltransferase [Chloroflexota bacterium]MCI0729500.1 glycosyltransferase [Chloroflexota bacterium]